MCHSDLPGVVGTDDAFGTRSGDPEHVQVDVGKCGAEGLRECSLEDATDLERVCVCAIQGGRNGETDVVVGLGQGRYRGGDPRSCHCGRRHRLP